MPEGGHALKKRLASKKRGRPGGADRGEEKRAMTRGGVGVRPQQNRRKAGKEKQTREEASRG